MPDNCFVIFYIYAIYFFNLIFLLLQRLSYSIPCRNNSPWAPDAKAMDGMGCDKMLLQELKTTPSFSQSLSQQPMQKGIGNLNRIQRDTIPQLRHVIQLVLTMSSGLP